MPPRTTELALGTSLHLLIGGRSPSAKYLDSPLEQPEMRAHLHLECTVIFINSMLSVIVIYKLSFSVQNPGCSTKKSLG